MLTDLELRALKPAGRACKVADQRCLYVAVTLSGVVSFRSAIAQAGGNISRAASLLGISRG